MEVILVRHFQTPGNLKHQYIGTIDESILTVSRDHPLVKKRLVDCQGADVIITTSMKRCKETAAFLFPSITPIICEKMRECNFGVFEGKSYEELKDIPAYQNWLDTGGVCSFPEGEAQDEFKARCVEGFLDMMNEMYDRDVKKVVMVVHGGTIMSVLSSIDSKKRGFYDFQVENGGGYRVILNEALWVHGQLQSKEIEQL